MRPNLVWPAIGGTVRFVGGIPNPYHEDANLENVHEGEVLDSLYSDGVTWLRVHILGVSGNLLVPVENLRP